jgi:rod shape determining protein RodA
MLRINRRVWINFDWVTLLIVVLISVIGVLTIFSTTRQPYGTTQAPFYLKQLLWLCIGLVSLLLIVSFDYIWLSRLSIPLYVAGLALLGIVMIFGKTGMGAQRWLSLGPVSFQPSEFFKLIFIIMLANSLSLFQETIGLKSFLRTFFFIALLPFLLILKQPDLGTAIVLLILFFLLMVSRGIQRKALILIMAVSIVSLPFLGSIVWSGLKEYQKNRLIAFVDPDVDPSGIGYHIKQSKIAIGSGEFFGKGFFRRMGLSRISTAVISIFYSYAERA